MRRILTLTLVFSAFTISTLRAEDKNPKERIFAWKLGVKLAKVAWVYYKGAPADVYEGELDACKQLASKGLGTSVPPFPARKTGSKDSEVQALNYISDIGAKPIAKDLQSKYGVSMAGLFELAMKADLATRLYAPGKKDDSLNVSLQKGLADAGRRSEVPEKLWQPLVNAIKSGGSHDAVKAAVAKLDHEVTEHLKAKAGMAGK